MPCICSIDDAEARLAYVAVTRTRQRLDIGGLSWVQDHPDGNPIPSTAELARCHTGPK